MADNPEAVADEMRSTLARLAARGQAATAAHGRIRDAALHRNEVVDAGLAGHRVTSIQSGAGLDDYVASLTERERLHRLAALPQ